jgi:DNA-binding winged helix-turn-helix (wHTH) protein
MGGAEEHMRIAIIGGNSEDERHLGRLAEKAGHSLTFVSAPAAEVVLLSSGQRLPPAPRESDSLAEVVRVLEADPRDEVGSGVRRAVRPRALVFDAPDRVDVALRVLGAVRRDAYFEGVGTLVIVKRDQAAALNVSGGFDDFILSPADLGELVLRIRAVGRRRASRLRASASEASGVVMDETSRDVIVGGHAVQLTAREFALFTYLCEWRGKVLSREHLLARVWGSRYSGGRRTVDIHVRRLRAKLGASLAIETLRGSGYRLRREPDAEAAGPATTAQLAAAQMPEPFSKVS